MGHWLLLVRKMQHISQGSAATHLTNGGELRIDDDYKFTAEFW